MAIGQLQLVNTWISTRKNERMNISKIPFNLNNRILLVAGVTVLENTILELRAADDTHTVQNKKTFLHWEGRTKVYQAKTLSNVSA